MESELKVYIDRLNVGESLSIQEMIDPRFMDIEEKELLFDRPIEVVGEATLADKEIALRLSIKTSAKIICSICNNLFDFPISIPSFVYSQPIVEIKDHILDCKELLREAILLEIPFVAECHQGHCPERKQISRYLASEDREKKDHEEWHPFKDLS